jgi:hypothetical protein
MESLGIGNLFLLSCILFRLRKSAFILIPPSSAMRMGIPHQNMVAFREIIMKSYEYDIDSCESRVYVNRSVTETCSDLSLIISVQLAIEG